jgi:hypothetical protein
MVKTGYRDDDDRSFIVLTETKFSAIYLLEPTYHFLHFLYFLGAFFAFYMCLTTNYCEHFFAFFLKFCVQFLHFLLPQLVVVDISVSR